MFGEHAIRPRLVASGFATNFLELIDATDPVIPHRIDVSDIADAVHFSVAVYVGRQCAAQHDELGAIQPMQKIPYQTHIEQHLIVSAEGGRKCFGRDIANTWLGAIIFAQKLFQ